MDLEAYARRSQQGPCFICELLNGNPEYMHHVVFEDDHSVAFVTRVFPAQFTTLRSRYVGIHDPALAGRVAAAIRKLPLRAAEDGK